jgi:hypothetical protein
VGLKQTEAGLDDERPARVIGQVALEALRRLLGAATAEQTVGRRVRRELPLQRARAARLGGRRRRLRLKLLRSPRLRLPPLGRALNRRLL